MGNITLDSSSTGFWTVLFEVATKMAVPIKARNIAHNGKDRSVSARSLGGDLIGTTKSARLQ
jgi:hypothetical protein